MRDLFLSALCFLGLPISLVRPYLGLLFFSWMAYMRPQDLTWGFARTFQWSKFIAIFLLVGGLFNNKERLFRIVPITIMILALWIFIGLSVIFSVSPDDSIQQFTDYCKIFLISLITIGLINTEKRLYFAILTLVFALGFHGTKSGLVGILAGFSIKNGPGGMIFDNNDFSLALLMTVPMMYYFSTMQKRKIFRLIFLGMAGATTLCIFWTHSRGGFLGVLTVWFLISWSWRYKIATLLFWVIVPPIFLILAPESLIERYSTIKSDPTKITEGSAVSRMHHMTTAFYIGANNLFVGTGPNTMLLVYWDYAPAPESSKVSREPHVAHCTYLQIFAESGLPAAATLLALLLYSHYVLLKIRIAAKENRYLEWSLPYAQMLQASLGGFMVSGTFLSRHYFDLMYQTIAIVAALNCIVDNKIKEHEEEREKQYKLRKKISVSSLVEPSKDSTQKPTEINDSLSNQTLNVQNISTPITVSKTITGSFAKVARHNNTNQENIFPQDVLKTDTNKNVPNLGKITKSFPQISRNAILTKQQPESPRKGLLETQHHSLPVIKPSQTLIHVPNPIQTNISNSKTQQISQQPNSNSPNIGTKKSLFETQRHRISYPITKLAQPNNSISQVSSKKILFETQRLTMMERPSQTLSHEPNPLHKTTPNNPRPKTMSLQAFPRQRKTETMVLKISKEEIQQVKEENSQKKDEIEEK